MDNQRILKEGELVQWYRIEEVLGRGGFGVTYLATDTNLDHKVAIKEYMPGWAVERLDDNSLVAVSDTVQRDFDLGVSNFLREARTLVKFRHPNIVRVMTVFEANNTAYLVMEYEEGEEFKSYVQRGAGIDEKSLKALILCIVDGLDQVHQTGFLHRDIKPVNLIIRNDGTPVLLDFGAARPTDSESGAHTAYVSAGYTPIEQYQEGHGMEIGPWTDIYSLGATLYYAISGKTPVGPTGRLAALVRKSPDALEPAKNVGAGRYSQPFLEAIDWALSFRPADRPQNLTEWRDALDASSEQQRQEEQRQASREFHQTASDERRPPSRLHREMKAQKAQVKKKRWVVALCSLLAVGAAGAWFYSENQQQHELNALLSQANSEFNNESYVEGALPLYRQVLTAYPENKDAKSRLADIETIVSARFNSQIQAGDLQKAELSLAELRVVTADESTTNEAQQRLEIAKNEEATNAYFSQAQSFTDSGQYQQALTLLSTLRSEVPDDPRLNIIESDVRAALKESLDREQQQSKLAAQQERKALEENQRTAAAKRRERQRRLSYNRYLRNAERVLSEGDIESARSWLDDARALQINDSRLTELESQVVEQETYQRKPLSDYEVSFAAGQFNALRRAVESKNRQAISALSEGEPKRQSLFDTLFTRYTRLDAKIVDIKPAVDPKRVTAKLRIEAMIMPNGDIVYPSPAYRDSELTINRERYGWSQIIW